MRRNLFVVAALIAVALGAWLWRRHSGASTEDAPPTASRPSDQPPQVAGGGSAPTGSRRTTAPGVISPRAPGTAGEPTATPPSLASGSDDIYANGARFTPRIQEISTSIEKLIDQCYQQTHALRPDVRGKLKLKVRLAHDPAAGNLIAESEVDKAHTTVADPELLQCATENVFASEEVLDKLRADSDPTGGNIEINLDLEFPPPPKVKPPWPADDASPDCAPGTALAGDKPPRGEQQWCQRADGTKDGDLYMWDKGKLETIMLYVNGSSNSLRMRPPE